MARPEMGIPKRVSAARQQFLTRIRYVGYTYSISIVQFVPSRHSVTPGIEQRGKESIALRNVVIALRARLII
jgi:hypothetical protein